MSDPPTLQSHISLRQGAANYVLLQPAPLPGQDLRLSFTQTESTQSGEVVAYSISGGTGEQEIPF